MARTKCCRRKEEWRPIPGVEGSEASSRGNIRRVGKERPLKYRKQVRLGTALPAYLCPFQRDQTRQRGWAVWERAVCAAFHGEPLLPGLLVHHKDENKQHRCVENLEWISVSRHVRHHRRKR